MERKGFTIIELLIVAAIVIIILFFVMFLPPFFQEGPTHLNTCKSNLSKLRKAIMLYASDNNGQYPIPNKWCDLIKDYDVENHLVCPTKKETGEQCSYAINPNCDPNSPPDTVLLFETKDGWNQFGGREALSIAHRYVGKGSLGTRFLVHGCNVLFNDGRVEFVKPDEVGELKWEDKQVKNQFGERKKLLNMMDKESKKDIAERNKALQEKNPYSKATHTAASESASRLRKQVGHYKGVFEIFAGNYHGSMELHASILTEDYAKQLKSVIPDEFEGFGVRIHYPAWSLGELCPEYRDRIKSFGLILHGSKKWKERQAFIKHVMSEEKKKRH